MVPLLSSSSSRPAHAEADAECHWAALDMQAHRSLAERNLDGDLKCILRGISEDLPLKLKALEEAKSTTERDTAIADMGYLLNDNVEVITAPPQAPV